MSAEREWEFNRRRVVDQTVYVRASSLKEAWRKARAGDVLDASDDAVSKITIRRLKDDPHVG